MDQQPKDAISQPSQADTQRLQRQRLVVEAYLATDDDRERYLSAEGKLATIQAILDGRLLGNSNLYELQCLGVVLGDAFVQHMGMEWVLIEDENGRDPAVRMPETSIILFPLTMIQKRFDDTGVVDVFGLFNNVGSQVVALQRRGIDGITTDTT